ncbi:MAG: sensor histidine kinase [Ferruginibacter sp.]
MKRLLLIPLLLFFLSIHSLAQVNADSLIKELANANEDTSKVTLLRNIGNALAHRDAHKAISYWQQGIILGRKLNYSLGLARIFINIGVGYSFISKFDSAIVFYDSAIVYSKIINDPERLALAYLNKGDAYRNLGDLKPALINCDTARMYAEKTTNTDRQARIYSVISSIYIDQNQFANAIPFIYKAVDLYKKDGNNIMIGQAYDDLGIIYKETGRLDSSLLFRQMAVAVAEREKDYKNLSVYYFGIAEIYSMQHKYKEAEQYAAKSLKYAEQQENNLQLGNTYSLLCNIYLQQKRYDEAIEAGNTAWKYSLQEVQGKLQQETAAMLAEAYTAAGNYKEANHFLTISSNLKDSLGRQLFNEEVAGLQASFQMKEKDKEILLLEKDKELQQQKLFRQLILFAAAAGLLLFTLLGVALFINRNRLRQRMKELELRNQIAADLHDEIGSSLSSIHMLSQMAAQPGNEATHKDILGRMSTNAKETMDKMGDIVWMIKPGEKEAGSLKQRMERFAYEICSSKNIEVNMQLEDLEKTKLSMEQRKNIYLIFKEALNNAVKYSGTEKIEITSTLQNNQLTLQVKDFGKGFDSSIVKKGNGLDNMQHRAKELNGELMTEAVINTGTTIQLIVPV